MIASTKQTIDDIIIETLAKKPYSLGTDLVAQIQKRRINTTKQAVYTALKSLLENEIVSKVQNKYFLSRVWLNKIEKLLLSKDSSSDAIFELQDGESISYHFPSLLTCDTYWAHIFDLLVEWIPAHNPIFVWNPHEWFAIARHEEESEIFKQIELKNKHALYSISGKTPLDQDFKRNWSTEHVSISTGSPMFFKNNYYLNIFKNIILEVFIDEKLADTLDIFYNKHTELIIENTRELKDLVSKKYTIRMKISKNTKKSTLLKKKLVKDFYLKKGLKID